MQGAPRSHVLHADAHAGGAPDFDVMVECDDSWYGWGKATPPKPLSPCTYSFDSTSNGRRRELPSPRPGTPQICPGRRISRPSQQVLPGTSVPARIDIPSITPVSRDADEGSLSAREEDHSDLDPSDAEPDEERESEPAKLL